MRRRHARSVVLGDPERFTVFSIIGSDAPDALQIGSGSRRGRLPPGEYLLKLDATLDKQTSGRALPFRVE